jgi:hypothetical protein
MPKYRFLEKGFAQVNPDFPPRLVEVGEEVDLPEEVYPGPYMQPVDAAAIKRFQKCLDKTGHYVPAPMAKLEDQPLATFATFDTTKLMEGARAG